MTDENKIIKLDSTDAENIKVCLADTNTETCESSISTSPEAKKQIDTDIDFATCDKDLLYDIFLQKMIRQFD